jgi:hypothetical protein
VRVADGEVRLVAQCHHLGVLGLELPDRIEELEAALRLTGTHERDAEVELPVGDPVARTLPGGQLRDCLFVALPVQEPLRD